MNGIQFRTMLWLRWRLTRNQWRRGGQLSAAIMIVLLIGGLVSAVVGGIAGVAIGALGLSHESPQVGMLVWDGLVVAFLFFWILGVVTELQRSEMIDLSRLLHLPVSLKDVFLLNYLASHFSLSLAMMLPVMLGLTVGLVLGRGVAMVLLLPLVFGFFFMITAWTYCLRGWLAALMVNKRRRRAIIMGVTLAFILLFQLPNLLTNVWFLGRRANPPANPAEAQEWLARYKEEKAKQKAEAAAVLVQVHRYVPLLWLPNGAGALAEGRAWPALWGAFGMIAIGAWGMVHAYRGTVRFYRGVETGKPAPAPSAVQTANVGRRILVERTLPAVPEDAGALALAGLRSMSRAPEIKMALFVNVLIFAFLGASMLLRGAGGLPTVARPFLASAAVAVTFLGLTQVMFNHFGFDRNGFRTLVLLPTPRRHMLLGKNLALLPVALGVFAFYLVLATVLAHLRASDILTAVLEFIAALLAMSVLGNLASILVPYRISAGSLKPTKTSFTTSLLLFVTHLLFMLAMLPVFLPAALGLLGEQFGGLSGTAVTLTCAAVLAVCSTLFYWRTLEPLGRLLQRREQKILQTVTQEVE